jgi:hypothetical protein
VRRSLLVLVVLALSFSALATGCVTRTEIETIEGPPLWAEEPEVLVKNRNRSTGKGIFGRFLRAGGRVECSGWLFKTQTTHVYARTSRGRDGKDMISPRIMIRAVYLNGLLKGASMQKSSTRESVVESQETIRIGFNPGFECSCVYVTATAPVQTGRTLVVTGQVCPEEE